MMLKLLRVPHEKMLKLFLGTLFICAVVFVAIQSKKADKLAFGQSSPFGSIKQAKAAMYGDAEARESKCEYWVIAYGEAIEQAKENPQKMKYNTSYEAALAGVLSYCR